jgi:hypothetical protein
MHLAIQQSLISRYVAHVTWIDVKKDSALFDKWTKILFLNLNLANALPNSIKVVFKRKAKTKFWQKEEDNLSEDIFGSYISILKKDGSFVGPRFYFHGNLGYRRRGSSFLRPENAKQRVRHFSRSYSLSFLT